MSIKTPLIKLYFIW